MSEQINVEFKAGKVWLYRNGTVSVVIPAELVEAAPAMLEALHHIKAVRCLGMHAPPVDSPAWHAWNNIDAAIAAAEQEPDNG